MKNRFLICFLLAMAAATQVHAADCPGDQAGNVTCGKGECATNRYGKEVCAKPGGGAMTDQVGNVKCGAGPCGMKVCAAAAVTDAALKSANSTLAVTIRGRPGIPGRSLSRAIQAAC